MDSIYANHQPHSTRLQTASSFQNRNETNVRDMERTKELINDNPYIYIPAQSLPTDSSHQNVLNSRLLRYKPLAIQARSNYGWYIIFPSTHAGRELAEGCWRDHHRTNMDGYTISMAYYKSGCPFKVNEQEEITQRRTASSEQMKHLPPRQSREGVSNGSNYDHRSPGIYGPPSTRNSTSLRDPRDVYGQRFGLQEVNRDFGPNGAESHNSQEKGTPVLRQIAPRPNQSLGSNSPNSGVNRSEPNQRSSRSTANNKEDDAISISSSPSSGSTPICEKCKQVEASFDPLIQCACKRRYHPKCHYPFIQPDQHRNPEWRCQYCVQKRKKLSSNYNDHEPKAQALVSNKRKSDGDSEKLGATHKSSDSKNQNGTPRSEAFATSTKMPIQNSIEANDHSHKTTRKLENNLSASLDGQVEDGKTSENASDSRKNKSESISNATHSNTVEQGTSEPSRIAGATETRASSASMSMDTSLSESNTSPAPEHHKRVLQVEELLQSGSTNQRTLRDRNKIQTSQPKSSLDSRVNENGSGSVQSGKTDHGKSNTGGNPDHVAGKGQNSSTSAIPETPGESIDDGIDVSTVREHLEETKVAQPSNEDGAQDENNQNYESPVSERTRRRQNPIKRESIDGEISQNGALNNSSSLPDSSTVPTETLPDEISPASTSNPFTITPTFKGDGKKPNMTYVQLVTEAFSHSRTGELTTIQICWFIMQTYRHYAEDWTKEILCSRLSAILSQYPQFTKHPPRKDSGSKYCTYTLEDKTHSDAQARARKRKRSESSGSESAIAKERSQRPKTPPPTRRRADDASDATMPPGASQEYMAKAGSGVIDRIRPDIKRWESLESLSKSVHDGIEYCVGDIVKIRLGDSGSEFARVQEMKIAKDGIIAVAVLWFASKANKQTKYHGEWPDGCTSILTNSLEICKLGTLAGKASDEELQDMHLGSKILDVTSRTIGRESLRLRDQEESDLAWTDLSRPSSRPTSQRLNHSQYDRLASSPATPKRLTRDEQVQQQQNSTSSKRTERSRTKLPDYRSTRVEDLPGPERFLVLKALADAKSLRKKPNQRQATESSNHGSIETSAAANPVSTNGVSTPSAEESSKISTISPQRRTQVSSTSISADFEKQMAAKDAEIAKLRAELSRVRSNVEQRIPWVTKDGEYSINYDDVEIDYDASNVELADFESMEAVLAQYPEYRRDPQPNPYDPRLQRNKKANFGKSNSERRGSMPNQKAGRSSTGIKDATGLNGDVTTQSAFPRNAIPFNHNGYFAYRDGTKDSNGNFVNPNSIHIVRPFTAQDGDKLARGDTEATGKDEWGWSN